MNSSSIRLDCASARARESPPKSPGNSSRKVRMQHGSRPIDETAALGRRPENFKYLFKAALRAREHPLVVERPAAAQIAPGNSDAKAGALEHLDRGDRDFGLEEIGEGIGKQNYLAPRSVSRVRRRASNHERKVRRAKRGSSRSRWIPTARFTNPAKIGLCASTFARPGAICATRANSWIRPKRCACQRAAMLLVIVGKELGLVRRHIDRGRAFGLASLARQAQIERLGERRIGETTGQRAAAQRLEQQARAPARRMHLFARRHVRRAHRAGVGLAAFADPDAFERRAREAAVAR